MTATHFTGADGAITIGGSAVTVVDFSIDIDRSVIASGRVGKRSDKKYPGKLNITGAISQVLVTPELLSYVMGDSDSTTTSALEELFAATDLVSSGAWSEYTMALTTPSAPTTVKCTLTVGDGNATDGSIVIRGTNSSDDIVTEVINFAAMTDGDPAQVIYGSQQFKTTDYVDVDGNLQPGGATTDNTLKIEGISGTKTMSPGESTMFNIIGKVEDSDNNYAQITANNCFFTAGNFPVGDSDTLVECNLPFVIQDPDEDLTLMWTTT